MAERFLDKRAEHELLSWLEAGAPWRLVEADFYQQYEFRMFDACLPASLAWLVSPDELGCLRNEFGRALGCRLSERMDFVAHKLMPGQRIAVHNDHILGGETHRLTVHLNRGLQDSEGGFMMLFDDVAGNEVHRILRPVPCTAIGFEIGSTSYHAVSRLHSGERYTLVYSFYAESPHLTS